VSIRLIWAEAHGGVIGAAGGIPWRIPGEQAIFKQRTMGSTVVMGRATWDSLPPRWRPLPGRHNVVLTRSVATPGSPPSGAPAPIPAGAPTAIATPTAAADSVDAFVGAETAGSIEEVLGRYDDFWVMGGAAVYAAFLPHADVIVRTEIDLDVEGDTFAPELGPEWSASPGEWQTPTSGPRYRVVEHRRGSSDNGSAVSLSAVR
jgi:dihydrofolate reductase